MASAAILRWTIAGIALCMIGCEVFAPPPDRSGTYAPCCDGLAICIPSAVVPAEFAKMVARDSCVESLSCVPRDLLSERRAPRASCTSSGLGAEGRCLPGCIPLVADRAEDLARDGCDPGMLCVPCFDPIDGHSTGACNLGSDPGPEQPARLLTDCCGGLGRCAPEELVPAQYDQLLGRDVCEAHELCVAPEQALTDPQSLRVAACVDDALGSEGRCLPSCLPLVAQRVDQLARYGCSVGNLCVPCFDPLSGESTGACELGADPGPRQAPTVAPTCCGGEGRCLPRAKVPAGQSENLAALDCTGAGEPLCVAPRGLIETPNYRPPACVDEVLLAEGRCLPACLPDVAARASSLRRASCGPASLCVPCFDPLSGEATKACELGEDLGPTEPSRVLPRCCEGRGRCAPAEAVPAAVAPNLDADSCAERQLCVAPESLLANPKGAPVATCRDARIDAEGRCLPSCLPVVRARAKQLAQNDCPEGDLCVPCFDPILGEPSGACSLGGDPGPHEPPSLLSACCDGQGRCTPQVFVPESTLGQFDRGTCSDGEDMLCVAPVAALVAPDTFRPESCSDPVLQAEGRCLPECLPQVSAQEGRLRRADCADGNRCVPCFDPVNGTPTGACSSNGDAPTEPPHVFAGCCRITEEVRGVCVPPELLPADAPALPQDTCGSGTSCAPLKLARDPDASLEVCRDLADQEGRCVLNCLLQPGQPLLLTQTSCGFEESCVPCNYAGLSTGVCGL
jgi:hypothetical protein